MKFPILAPKRPPVKELNYMKKEDFGKIPAYLSQVKEEVKRENEMIERYVKQQMGEVEAERELQQKPEYLKVSPDPVIKSSKLKFNATSLQTVTA
jgi:hypothetical protein